MRGVRLISPDGTRTPRSSKCRPVQGCAGQRFKVRPICIAFVTRPGPVIPSTPRIKIAAGQSAEVMWPVQTPFQPTVHDLHNNGRAFPPNHLHESWLDYLYWDIELEP